MLVVLFLLAGVSPGSVSALEPSFTLHDLDGRPHGLADYRGRWVVVNYWATWCPPCLEEMPELDHFHRRFESSGGTVLGPNLEEIDSGRLREFVDSFDLAYPILLSGPRPTGGMPAIRGLPTTHVVGPGGEIVETRLGPVTSALLEDIVRNHGAELGPSLGDRIVKEVCVKCFVSGRVQGVWYRGTAQNKALELGLRGYAENLADGRVEVIACGSSEAVERLVDWLAEGPPMASVTGVERQAASPDDYRHITGFATR